MKPLRLLVLLVSLPLLLGGCGENVVNDDEIEYREGILYLKDSDVPYTGKVFVWYENGKKEQENKYKDGKRHGLTTWWYENGQKKLETENKDGKFHGLLVEWHENGQKSNQGNYKHGKSDGLWMAWHENGQKQGEGNRKDGNFVEGSARFWNSKGEPVDSWEETGAE